VGPLALGAIAVAFALFGTAGQQALRFDRAALAAGEWWRLVTGHFVHLGTGHVLLNLAGLAVLAYIFAGAGLSPRWWLTTTLFSAAAIDAGLLALQPDLDWYVGLSGVLHGFWAAGAIALLIRGEGWFAWLLLAALCGKLIAERAGGPSELTQLISGGNVVTAAHLYGALGGLIAAATLHGMPRLLGPGRQL
jgi:rhomboid family GlyGly-CTERM serine protease